MTTVSRSIPSNPHIEVPKKQSQELLKRAKQKFADALNRIRRNHPRFSASEDSIISTNLKLSDAQLVIAREYGFSSWLKLKRRILGNSAAHLIDGAIREGNAATITYLLTAYPEMLDIPLISGNWGPPMSHAANLGQFEMVKVIASLGAKDFQHAFERALLHGDIEIAKWLHEHGAEFMPGIIMGCCETLNARGFVFLDEAGVPMVDATGNSLAPLACVLETYCRNPRGKHEILSRWRDRGLEWMNTTMTAFHLGDITILDSLLKSDPQLINRRFAYAEIFPPELGCSKNPLSGLHGTPISGTTLLHLSIDYDEREIFDWLVQKGADVNAAAIIDAEGFGGHTPLYNALVSQAYAAGRQHDAYMVSKLLDKGAKLDIRINLRKYLDWIEEPKWHIANAVSPLAWAEGFPISEWVNKEGLGTIESKA